MADKRVIRQGYVSLAATVITTLVSGFTLTRNAGEVVVSTFGAPGVQREAGLLDNNCQINVFHDVVETINNLLYNLVGTKVAFILRADNAAMGVNNPEFRGTSVFLGYEPLKGNVGEASSTTLNLPVDGESTKHTS